MLVVKLACHNWYLKLFKTLFGWCENMIHGGCQLATKLYDVFCLTHFDSIQIWRCTTYRCEPHFPSHNAFVIYVMYMISIQGSPSPALIQVCAQYVGTLLNRTPVFVWYMARVGVKNGHQNDMCYNEIANFFFLKLIQHHSRLNGQNIEQACVITWRERESSLYISWNFESETWNGNLHDSQMVTGWVNSGDYPTIKIVSGVGRGPHPLLHNLLIKLLTTQKLKPWSRFLLSCKENFHFEQANLLERWDLHF